MTLKRLLLAAAGRLLRDARSIPTRAIPMPEEPSVAIILALGQSMPVCCVVTVAAVA